MSQTAANGCSRRLEATLVDKTLTESIEVIPALLERIPVPRNAALREMKRLASVFEGSEPIFSSCNREMVGVVIAEFSLVLLATACWRPLLCEEAQEIQEHTGLNVVVIRSDDRNFLGEVATTLDVLLAQSRTWLFRLRPWRKTHHDDLWFAPVEGEGRAVRFIAGLVALSPRAPFSSLFERECGFDNADRVSRLDNGELGATDHG